MTEFPMRFLRSEWTHVVDAWQVADGDGYLKVPRLGRKNRLGSKQRPTRSGLRRLRGSLDYVIARTSGRRMLMRLLSGLNRSASLCTFTRCTACSAQR